MKNGASYKGTSINVSGIGEAIGFGFEDIARVMVPVIFFVMRESK